MPPRLRSAVSITLASMLATSALLRAQDSAGGRDIYLAKCAKCHGKNGVPRRIAKGAPNFADPNWSIPLERIVSSVLDGKGEEMPRFRAKLDLEQVKRVSVFVQGIKHGSLHPPGSPGRDPGDR
jgi:mono/diheme cytochrome c family protein